MILGARRAQLPAIRSALNMGLNVIAIDPDPTSPGLAIASSASVLDLADQEAILALAKSHRIDGVMTLAADYPMPTLAAVCANLKLPGPTPDVVARATNKRLMRQFLSAARVPCPTFKYVNNPDDAVQAVTELTGDAILKPTLSHGGRGVTRVPFGSPKFLIEQAFLRAKEESRSEGVMVEEFIEGPEFSIESLSYGGSTQVITVTDKLTSDSPYFVELGHNQPSRWPPHQVESLRTVALQAITALGIDQAAGHTEVRVSANGPVIMEVAARLGGGFISSHLVPRSTGIDLIEATIRVALGEMPDLSMKSQPLGTAIRFICPTPGMVSEIYGLEVAKHFKGIEEIEIYKLPGEHIPPLVDSRGRAGHVISTAKSPEEAIRRAEQALEHIQIRTFADGLT